MRQPIYVIWYIDHRSGRVLEIGEMRDGKVEGWGISYGEEDKYFHGQLINGDWDGYGVLWWEDGKKYEVRMNNTFFIHFK